MSRCQYRKNCKEYEDCNANIYCGLKEYFMEKKEAIAYRKKHLGVIHVSKRSTRIS